MSKIGSLQLVSVVFVLGAAAFAGCSSKDRDFAAPGTGGSAGGGSGGTAGAGAGGRGGGGTGGQAGVDAGMDATAGTSGQPGDSGADSGCDGAQCAVCTANQHRCLDTDTAQTCQANGTWGGDVNCTGDTPVCRTDAGNQCGCKEGERRCKDGTHPELCQLGAWVAQTACAGTLGYCLPTTGQCVDCTPGTEECSSASVAQRCDANGSWVSLNACRGTTVNCSGCSIGDTCTTDGDCTTSACVNNKCATCKPNAKSCSGVTPRTCSATGTWTNLSDCSGDTPVCVPATATCVCATNARKCLDSNTPQLCNASGQWTNQTDCSGATPACIASTGTCGCSNGTHRCLDTNTPQTCNALGQWGNDTDCSGQTPACISSTGTCGCSPNTHRCVGDTTELCSAQGQWGSSVTCRGATPVCLTSTGDCGLPTTPCGREDPAGGYWFRSSAAQAQTTYDGGTFTPATYTLNRIWGTDQVYTYNFGRMTLYNDGGFLFMRFIRYGSASSGVIEVEFSGTYLVEPGAAGAVTLTNVCAGSGTAGGFIDARYQAAPGRVVILYPGREEVWQ